LGAYEYGSQAEYPVKIIRIGGTSIFAPGGTSIFKPRGTIE
jgi:hypothetical protein